MNHGPDPENPDGTNDLAAVEWLPLPDVAERLGVPLRTVRGMISESRLLAVRAGQRRVWSVPDSFLIEGPDGIEVVPGLRGTLIQLADAGLDASDTMVWLHEPHPELRPRPIDVLRTGSTHAVRRAAQVLAW